MPTQISEKRAKKMLRTGGSDIAYILSAGRADAKQLRELKIG